jgi:hypothetical protein
MAIAFTKTTYRCGHLKYSGSTFGNPLDIAERDAREAGYFEEEKSDKVCEDCK